MVRVGPQIDLYRAERDREIGPLLFAAASGACRVCRQSGPLVMVPRREGGSARSSYCTRRCSRLGWQALMDSGGQVSIKDAGLLGGGCEAFGRLGCRVKPAYHYLVVDGTRHGTTAETEHTESAAGVSLRMQDDGNASSMLCMMTAVRAAPCHWLAKSDGDGEDLLDG